jgi:hypothetical protein
MKTRDSMLYRKSCRFRAKPRRLKRFPFQKLNRLCCKSRVSCSTSCPSGRWFTLLQQIRGLLHPLTLKALRRMDTPTLGDSLRDTFLSVRNTGSGADRASEGLPPGVNERDIYFPQRPILLSSFKVSGDVSSIPHVGRPKTGLRWDR